MTTGISIGLGDTRPHFSNQYLVDFLYWESGNTVEEVTWINPRVKNNVIQMANPCYTRDIIPLFLERIHQAPLVLFKTVVSCEAFCHVCEFLELNDLIFLSQTNSYCFVALKAQTTICNSIWAHQLNKQFHKINFISPALCSFTVYEQFQIAYRCYLNRREPFMTEWKRNSELKQQAESSIAAFHQSLRCEEINSSLSLENALSKIEEEFRDQTRFNMMIESTAAEFKQNPVEKEKSLIPKSLPTGHFTVESFFGCPSPYETHHNGFYKTELFFNWFSCFSKDGGQIEEGLKLFAEIPTNNMLSPFSAIYHSNLSEEEKKLFIEIASIANKDDSSLSLSEVISSFNKNLNAMDAGTTNLLGNVVFSPDAPGTGEIGAEDDYHEMIVQNIFCSGHTPAEDEVEKGLLSFGCIESFTLKMKLFSYVLGDKFITEEIAKKFYNALPEQLQALLKGLTGDVDLDQILSDAVKTAAYDLFVHLNNSEQ